MTTNEALAIINDINANTIAIYLASKESKDSNGNTIPHYLSAVTQVQKISALDFALKNVALIAKPVKLIESNDSTAQEFKRISSTEYIRTPQKPQEGGVLDIDEALCYAVVYKALSFLWEAGYSSYSSEANLFIASYTDATRDFFLNRNAPQGEAKILYFRYSDDGELWHDSFVDGDTYISFRQDGGVWTQAIKFVGSGGDGGSTEVIATTFKELTDTPSTLTEGKFLASGANNTIVEVDAPSGAEPQPFDGAFGVSNLFFKDFREIVGNYFYVEAGGDFTFNIPQTDGAYDIELGKLYTIELIPNGHTITLGFEALGDKTIDANASVVMIDILFDSLDIFIMANRSFL